mgnify:CR=1 FL=1
MNNNFNEYNLSDELIKAINDLGYKSPSEVQDKVIPEIMLNKDLIVKSQTGSGKTAAFAIPLCEKCDWDENLPQVLVLSPTRELAVQVNEDFLNIGRYKRLKSVAIYGKSPMNEQIRTLKQKTHIVVGTPGRILDHIDRESLKIEKIKYLVIDEGDLMLNMGFINQVEGILRRLPKKIVKLLFSATIPNEIKELCEKHMQRPVSITIKNQNLISNNIEHNLYYINCDEKLESLNSILINEKPETVVIFGRTKESVDKIFDYLKCKKYSVGKIHGGMMQKERLDTMSDFKQGNFRILVATDIAARGIDVDNLTHVINFELPVEKESYVHRIGRSGRAGAKGKAISFCTKENDRYLNLIEEYIGFNIPVKLLPSNEEINKEKDEGLNILKSKPNKKKEKGKVVNSKITKIYLNGGKKKKLRAGDIVGAICNIEGVTSDDIGIIDVQDNVSYVDILNNKGKIVIDNLKNTTIKGKKLKVEKARN